MSFSSRTKVILTVGGLVGALAGARAQAATCGTTDCGKGFTCVTTMIPIATPEPAQPPCPKNTACQVVAPEPVVDAGASTLSSCEPATCMTDGDCGADMVCNTQTIPCAGSGGACAAGTKCDTPSTSCTPTTTSLCRYKWELPCNADLDCGDGFTCMPSVSGFCSGSGGAPTPATGAGSAGASSAPNQPASDGGASSTPTCGMTTSFPGFCQAKVVPCTADSECPATWTCTSQAIEVGIGVALSGNTGTASTGAPAVVDAGAIDPAPAPAKVCTPPGGAFATPGTVDNGGAPLAASGSGGSTATGTTGAGGSTPGTKGGDQTSSTGTPSMSSSGCALGGRPDVDVSTFGLVALGLLGLARARRRR